jgi:hypothetical protein
MAITPTDERSKPEKGDIAGGSSGPAEEQGPEDMHLTGQARRGPESSGIKQEYEE